MLRLPFRSHGVLGPFWLDFRSSQGCFSVYLLKFCSCKCGVRFSTGVCVCVPRSLIAWASQGLPLSQRHHLAYEFRVLSLVRSFGNCPSSVRQCSVCPTLYSALCCPGLADGLQMLLIFLFVTTAGYSCHARQITCAGPCRLAFLLEHVLSVLCDVGRLQLGRSTFG